MFTPSNPSRPWSEIGLRVLIGAVAASVMLAALDGIWKGPVEASDWALSTSGHVSIIMIATWIVDIRYLADQAVYAATIFFIGAKFFETRSIFTIGFDKQDAAKISLEGPDENNIVWIGHRYATRMEAETVAEAFAERLKQSTVQPSHHV